VFSGHSSSETAAGASCDFGVTVADVAMGLQSYILSSNNSGVWVNSTVYTFVRSDVASVVKALTLNSTVGVVVQWKWFANDTGGNWAVSGVQSLITTGTSYVFVVGLSKAEGVVLQGDLVHFTVTVTRNSTAYTDFVANITRDGELLKQNVTGTFEDSEANNQGHTYNVSGLYDTGLAVAVTDYSVTALDVVWQSAVSGPIGPSGPTPTPTSDAESTPTGETGGDDLPLEFNVPFTTDEFLIGVVIVAISLLVALSLMQHKPSRSSLRKKHNQPLMSGNGKGKKDSSLL
jgi:hypothetical protein